MQKQGVRCYYCGDTAAQSGKNLVLDHFVPRRRGGSNKASNLVAACARCNYVKGSRLFADARKVLLFKRLGWPRFKEEQLQWLRENGFDTSPLDHGKLFFEEQQT